MKVYKVNVYNINQYHKVKSNQFVSINKIDKIIVVKDLFGVHELITNQPLIVYDDIYYVDDMQIKYFSKYGFIIGINKNDLTDENLITHRDLTIYQSMFILSKFYKFMNDKSTQDQINYKIKKIDKRIK